MKTNMKKQNQLALKTQNCGITLVLLIPTDQLEAAEC